MPTLSVRPANLFGGKFLYRILLATSLLVVAAIGGFALWSYQQQSSSVHRQIDAQLRAVGQASADGIAKWLGGRLLVIQTLADDLHDTDAAGGQAAAGSADARRHFQGHVSRRRGRPFHHRAERAASGGFRSAHAPLV